MDDRDLETSEAEVRSEQLYGTMVFSSKVGVSNNGAGSPLVPGVHAEAEYVCFRVEI